MRGVEDMDMNLLFSLLLFGMVGGIAAGLYRPMDKIYIRAISIMWITIIIQLMSSHGVLMISVYYDLGFAVFLIAFVFMSAAAGITAGQEAFNRIMAMTEKKKTA